MALGRGCQPHRERAPPRREPIPRAGQPPHPPAANAANPPRTPAPHDAYVYIGWPLDGATVGTKFKVWFGTRNFGVAPAGVTTKPTPATTTC